MGIEWVETVDVTVSVWSLRSGVPAHKLYVVVSGEWWEGWTQSYLLAPEFWGKPRRATGVWARTE